MATDTKPGGATAPPGGEDPDFRPAVPLPGDTVEPRDRSEHELISKLAEQPKAMAPEEIQDALEWFLGDDDSEADPTYPIDLNVGTDPDRKQWIQWVVKPIASQRIDQLRRLFQVPTNREQRRRGQTGDLDIARFNSALVFEGTVSPDLSIPIAQGKFADGSQLVMHRFRHKPLLVDQIAGHILFISGGDDEDLRITREVRAAGN